MRNRGFDRDRDRDRDDDRSGRELGGYRSSRSQDRGDWSSQSQRGDRDDVCPNCGYAMSDYGDRGYGYGARGSDRDRDRGDRYGIRTSDRYERDDRYDRGDRYERSDRYDREPSWQPSDRYDYSAGNRPRGVPDHGYGTWGSDRERGYATSSRNTSGWGRDEYDGRDYR